MTYPLMHMQETGLRESLLAVLAAIWVSFTDANSKRQLFLTQMEGEWGSNPVFQVGREWRIGTGI